MTALSVRLHLIETHPSKRIAEATWLLMHMPPYGEGWAEAKVQYLELTNPKTPELERAA